MTTDQNAPIPEAVTTLSDEEVRKPELLVGVQPTRETIEHAIFALAAARRGAASEEPLSHFAEALFAHAADSTAQLFQDIFALYFKEFARGGFFVEVGTGDGKLISNTYLLEKSYDWNGIVVEPNPVFLPVLKQHRSCTISTDCVLDVSGRRVTFECLSDPEFSGIAPSQLGARSDTIHAAKRSSGMALELETISLNELLDKYAAPIEIDYLSVDVEGAEFSILRTVDFDRWKIACITVEHNWGVLRDDIYELLTAQGYVRVFEYLSQWDDWYINGELLGTRPNWTTLLAPSSPVNPENQVVSLINWSTEALAHDEVEVARLLCLRALELAPKHNSAMRLMAAILRRVGRPAAAIECWRSALANEPDDYWAHLGLAELLLQRDERAEGIALLVRALGLADDTSAAQSVLDLASPTGQELADASRASTSE